MFNFFKKGKKGETSQPTEDKLPKESKEPVSAQGNEAENGEEIIDDISYIQEMQHIRGTWHQYDVLLAARGYGWDTIVEWAAYMEEADLDDISTMTVAETVNMPETEIIDEYRNAKVSIEKFDKLATERGRLSIGGLSRVLKAPVKIVWFNQTRVLKFFTVIDDDLLMTKYIETVIRRTFNTVDAMKLAKPAPKE
ncbi:MAG: hypothetical protein IJ168_10725 [Eubacterium sp.]|nr:hypothetical protein [Eubacterium sp.]